MGDEVGDKQQSLLLLDQWEAELAQCYSGEPRHPVFVALRETVREFDIPQHEFSDLLTGVPAGPDRHPLSALRRLAGILPVLGESRGPPGAVPVRLSRCRAAEALGLHLHGAATGELLAGCCRGLRERAEFIFRWKTSRSSASAEQEMAQRRATPQFLAMMKFEVERAREWFQRGLPLAKKVDRRAGARHRAIQPGRAGDSRRHRTAKVRRADIAASHLQAAQGPAAGARGPG